MFKFPAKFRAEKSHQGEWNRHGLANLVILALSWFAFALRWFLTLTVATGCLYQVVASPPLHLMGFPVKPAAGESSIYVPGAYSFVVSFMVPSSKPIHFMTPLTFVPSEHRRLRLFWHLVSLRGSTSPSIRSQS